MEAKPLSFNIVHFQSHCMVLTIVSGSWLQTLPPKRDFFSNPGDVAPINAPRPGCTFALGSYPSWVCAQIGVQMPSRCAARGPDGRYCPYLFCLFRTLQLFGTTLRSKTSGSRRKMGACGSPRIRSRGTNARTRSRPIVADTSITTVIIAKNSHCVDTSWGELQSIGVTLNDILVFKIALVRRGGRND